MFKLSIAIPVNFHRLPRGISTVQTFPLACGNVLLYEDYNASFKRIGFVPKFFLLITMCKMVTGFNEGGHAHIHIRTYSYSNLDIIIFIHIRTYSFIFIHVHSYLFIHPATAAAVAAHYSN